MRGNGRSWQRAAFAVLGGWPLALALPAFVAAQQPPPSLEPMQRLAFLVGEWRGSGWMEYAPGQRGSFTSWERVESKLGGRILAVEGRHYADIPGQAEPSLVHHAYGVFFHQPDGYRFRTWLANGHAGDFAASFDGGAFVWGYDDPRWGPVRYTITLSEQGEWVEVGDVDVEGSWRRFFEMRLARVE